MFAMVLNWKGYSSGSLVGFFDLSVCGLVVTGCRAFKKEDRVWFSWPSERVPDKNGGEDKWRDIVTAAEPTMKHLQGLVRPQIRALLESSGDQDQKPPGKPKFAGSSFRGEHGDRGYEESRKASKEDIGLPF